MAHHNLDIYPIPKDKSPMFINEPYLIDQSLLSDSLIIQDDLNEDNIRVYIPLDINREAVLRRIKMIIEKYGEANKENEAAFQLEIETIIAHIEIYDQIWFVRNMPSKGKHSLEGIKLVNEVILLLKEIPDGCGELFPFETIDALENEWI